jgi:hypothetical protein
VLDGYGDGGMKTSAARIGLRVALVATALGVSVALAGCIQSAAPLPGDSRVGSHSPRASDEPTPSPSPTQIQTQVVIDCNSLLTPAQVYAYNPNFVRDVTYKPKPGSVPAAIASELGQTCGWVNETSGDEIEVAVTYLPVAKWNAAKTAASGGTPIDAAGSDGYFSVTDGVGSAQLFYGTVWLDVSSVDFEAPVDASALYPIVVQNQRGLGG